MSTTYKIRSFVKEDAAELVEICAKRNYQIWIENFISWSQFDPGSIKVAVSDSGKIIGLISAVKFGDVFAFGGYLRVLEEHQNCGVGRALNYAGLGHAGKVNGGLNCYAERVNSNKKLGFTIVEESFSSLEYESESRLNVETLSDDLPEGVELKQYEDSYLDAISTYDRTLINLDREAILKLSCREENNKTLVAFNNGICIGFGSVKLSIFGRAKVGPLYADSPAVAQVMFKRLIEAMPNAESFQAITLSNNQPANEMFKKLGLPILGSFVRLYKKEKLIINASKVFCQFDGDFSPF